MTEPITTVCADDEPLSLDRLTRLLAGRSELDLRASCRNASEVVDALTEYHPELIVLDIKMPGLSGIELASHLRDASDDGPSVIFVTAHSEPAVQAFDLCAVDYVLKPYSRQRLDKAIDRFLAERCQLQLQGEKANVDRFVFRDQGRVRLIPFNAVESVRSNGKRVIVDLHSGKSVDIALSMKEARRKLPAPPFYRVSRFAIVNLDHMIEMEELFNDTAQMRLRSGRDVAVSRRGRRLLRDSVER